jgi:alpha-beta hydrolase superfamily lysophospholipase
MTALLGGLFLLAALAYGAVCYYLYKQQAVLLYPGDGQAFGPFDELMALGGEAVVAELDGQALRYYKVPAQGSCKAWVLLFHGNRDGARERVDFAQHMSSWGYSVILAELPGYAGDPVRASQRSLLRNGLAMADEAGRLAQSLPVFYFGESLGTAIATYCAMRRDPRGLLLSTPFTSMAAVAQARYPALPILALIQDKMPAALWAPHVICPVFIVHGTRDKVVPTGLGRAQAKQFRSPVTYVSIDGPGHSDIRDRFPQQYWGGVQAFLSACMKL